MIVNSLNRWCWPTSVPLLVGALLATTLLACGGPSRAVSATGVVLQNPDLLGHHEDYGVEGMRLNGDILEVSLGRACYDSIEEPVMVLGTPVYDAYGATMMTTSQVASQCFQGWPAGYARLITSEGEYPGQANGGGRVDIDVRQAPSAFWNRIDSIRLEVPNVSYTLELWLNDAVRAEILARASQGQPVLELSVTFSDDGGNDDGRLEPGEMSVLAYNAVNIGDDSAQGVMLTVSWGGVAGVTLDAPINVGTVAPGEVLVGEVTVHTDSRLDANSLIFEVVLEAASGHMATDRVVVPIVVDNSADRAWAWYEPNSQYVDYMRAGAARVQTVLTSTGRYVFVSDQETQDRIQRVVDLGGGSAQERFQIALDAAGGEAVERVFQLEINPMPGDEVQLVLAVYQTGTADRVYQTDTTAHAERSNEVLNGFEGLARTYLAWLEGR